MRAVFDQIGDDRCRQQQVHALRVAGQITQTRIGALRLAQLLDRGPHEARITVQRNRGRGLARQPQTDFQPPQRDRFVVGAEHAVGLEQAQYQFRLIDGETGPPPLQRLGHLVTAAFQRHVPHQRGR